MELFVTSVEYKISPEDLLFLQATLTHSPVPTKYDRVFFRLFTPPSAKPRRLGLLTKLIKVWSMNHDKGLKISPFWLEFTCAHL